MLRRTKGGPRFVAPSRPRRLPPQPPPGEWEELGHGDFHIGCASPDPTGAVETATSTSPCGRGKFCFHNGRLIHADPRSSSIAGGQETKEFASTGRVELTTSLDNGACTCGRFEKGGVNDQATKRKDIDRRFNSRRPSPKLPVTEAQPRPRKQGGADAASSPAALSNAPRAARGTVLIQLTTLPQIQNIKGPRADDDRHPKLERDAEDGKTLCQELHVGALPTVVEGRSQRAALMISLFFSFLT
jgi:hypothetical protein